ncbi:MAG: TPM domain-containing protein [Bacteroidota bacterium]|nr:TPM domain-containing protein [Bacteroidota bacterium]
MKHLLLLFVLIFTRDIVFSKDVPNVPIAHCTDKIGILQKATIDSLNLKLQQLQRETGTHFLVYIDDSLFGENLEEYVDRLFNTWELGEKNKNNGVLFAIFIKDRAFRISVGYGLEGYLPDLKLNRLQEELLIPELKNGNYDAGVSKLALAIINQLNGAEARAYEKALRLQISDPDNILDEKTKKELFYSEHETYFGLNNEYIYTFYHIQKKGSGSELNSIIDVQWDEIQREYPEKKLKILYAYSAKDHCYAIRTSEKLTNWINQPLFGSCDNFKNDTYLQTKINYSSYEYIFAGINYIVYKDLQRNQYISYHPIIYYLGSPFFEDYFMFYTPAITMSLFILFVYASIILPLTNLFILFFLYKDSKKSKRAFVGWTLLNIIVPVIGLILQFRILYKLLKILKKKGDYLKYIKAAESLGIAGHIKEFNKSSGSSTYSSSRSSGSSYSSKSYSSSSSSYSGYSGGGGGRTGGGGSSGRW